MVSSTNEVEAGIKTEYDRLSELKAFDESKAGVKGLVDAGISEIPQMFIQPPHIVDYKSKSRKTDYTIPVVDLQGIDRDPNICKQIVEQVKDASERWGFFQLVNHGIPVSILEEMENGVRRFYGQDVELKKKMYTRDATKKVVYNSNFDLYCGTATNWRDTFYCLMAPNPPDPEELPAVCR